MSNELEEGVNLTLRYDAQGLIPCITVCAKTGNVLMLAYMNAHALQLTLETGEAHYWSRSRGEIWHKGATSGAVQRVVSLSVDCDQDSLLLKVLVQGQKKYTCHTGRESCFYRSLDEISPQGKLKFS